MISLQDRPVVQVPVSQSQQQQQPAQVAGQNPAQVGIKTLLTNEEFDNLKRSIQLLRIEQIRYIVKRFSLPANGNKTRLIQIILGIIDTLRPTPLLVEMSMEVSRLLQQQHEPFANPLDSTHKMVPYKDQEPLYTPDHPFYSLTDKEPILGPLFAPVGNSNFHAVTLDLGEARHLLIEFSWKSAQHAPFDLIAHVNGTTLVVSSEDPNPQPIDISDLVAPPVQQLTFDIQSLKTQMPMTVSIREYELRTVHSIAKAMCEASKFTESPESVKIKGEKCTHNEGANLISFLSKYFSTKKSECPVCNNQIDIDHAVLFVDKK